jgi:porin
MKTHPLGIALVALSTCWAGMAKAQNNPSNQADVPVSEDRSLLESTQPTAAIVQEVTPYEPGQGSWLYQWWNGDAATGNWFGLRDTLNDSGVTLFASYEANMAGNVTGGRNRGFTYADNLDFGVRLDMEKLIGWNGATITVNGVNRNGESLTTNHIGNFYQVQQLFGVQTFMFYGLYLTQKFWDDRISIKIGRFATNEDFATSPIYGLYMGNGIDGNPKSLVASGAFSSYPGSVWAARVKVEPTKETNASFGVYQTNTRLYNGDKHGFDWSMQNGDGVMLIGQVGWSPEFFKKPVAVESTAPRDGKSVVDGKSSAKSFKEPITEMKGLPGHYWFGSYVALWDAPQFGSTQTSNSLYGFYWHADQMVYQESPGSGQGLTLWADFVLQPSENVNVIPYQLSGGVLYKGLIPQRDEDVLLFGIVYGTFSRDYAQTVQQAGGGSPKYEMTMEWGYRIQLTKFSYVMPDVQYIVNPGGTNTLGNALVLGLRVGVTF